VTAALRADFLEALRRLATVFDAYEAETGARPVPTIGVQLVSGRLFDGRTDPQRITLLPIEDGGTIALAPIEDMIADRLGQYAASDGRDGEMLDQARLLFKLAGDIDREYLIKRALEETGDPALLGLR
jgi:hypothetical protein